MLTDRSKEIPFWMGHGTADRVVQFAWGEQSSKKLKDFGYTVDWNSYAGLEHSADTLELNDLEKWLAGKVGEE